MNYGKKNNIDRTPELVIGVCLFVALLIVAYLALKPALAESAGRPGGARPTATMVPAAKAIPQVVTLSEVELLYEGTYRAKVNGTKSLLTARTRTAPPLKNGRCDISQYTVS